METMLRINRSVSCLLNLTRKRFTESYTKDTFGNFIYNNYTPMRGVIEYPEEGKAILLKNSNQKEIYNYNEEIEELGMYGLAEKDIDMLKAKFQCQPGVYLIRNWSKCSELYNGEFIAGGVNILIEHNGDFYTPLMKDKTKDYLTCPGGTATISDIDGNVNIGIRELWEETTSDDFCGINLAYLNLPVLCKFYFKSRFFDIDGIPDTYTMNKFVTSTKDKSNPNLSLYLSRLFDSRNLCDEHCYKLSYNNHDETEFVYALNLTSNMKSFETTSPLIDQLFLPFSSDLYKQRNIINKYSHPVTYLHVAMSQFNLFTECIPFTVSSSTTIVNNGFPNFPKNLTKLDLFTHAKE